MHDMQQIQSFLNNADPTRHFPERNSIIPPQLSTTTELPTSNIAQKHTKPPRTPNCSSAGPLNALLMLQQIRLCTNTGASFHFTHRTSYNHSCKHHVTPQNSLPEPDPTHPETVSESCRGRCDALGQPLLLESVVCEVSGQHSWPDSCSF